MKFRFKALPIPVLKNCVDKTRDLGVFALCFGLLCFAWGNLRADASEWVDGGDGNWSNSTNWDTGVPNAAQAQANFFDSAGAGFPPAVTSLLDINATVGILSLSNSNTVFTLASDGGAGHGLTLDNGGVSAVINVGGGNHIISALVGLSDNLQIAISSSNASLTINGAISENSPGRSLTLNDVGTLILAGSNSYSGDTIISAGILQVGGGNAIPSGAGNGNLVNNSTLDLNNYDTTVNGLSGTGLVTNSGTGTAIFSAGANNASSSFGGTIEDGNGQVALTKIGTGTLTLTGVNTCSGDTTISAGTLQVGNAQAILSGIGSGNVVDNATLDLNNISMTIGGLSGHGVVTNSGTGRVVSTVGSNDQGSTFSGVIQDGSGHLSLTKTGVGTLYLTGTNTYSGDTTISAGTLQIGSATAIPFGAGKGDVIVNGTLDLNHFDTTVNGLFGNGFVTNSGTVAATFAVGASDVSSTFAGVLQDGIGQLAVTKVGTGTLTVIGLNTYSGATTISVGALQIGDGTTDGSIASNSGITNNGTLIYNVAASGTSANLIGGGGTLAKTGAGILTLSGANTYTGATTISEGTVKLGGATALGDTVAGTTVSPGAVLDLNGQTVGAEGLTINGTGISSGGALVNSDGTTPASFGGAISLGSDSSLGGLGDLTLSGAISGASKALTKTGAGMLTLSGSNTYTGATTISEGSLTVNGSLAAGSAVSLASDTVLSGTGTVRGTVTVADSATAVITAGDGVSGTLTIGNLTFSGAGTINFGSLSNYLSSGALDITGALTLNGGAGAVTLALAASVLGNGTYHLIGHGNTLADLSGLTVTNPSLGSRQFGTLANNSGMIDYVVAGDYPYWTGADSTEWDTVSNNWKLVNRQTVTQFQANDAVLFDDNAITTTVNIGADVNPASVLFNNSTTDYTLQGAGGISSGSLTKSGSGALTITNANSYNGGTTLNAGVLKAGNDSALGAGLITLNGGTLSSDSTTAHSLANNLLIGGNVTLGDAINSGALTFSGTVDLAGTTWVETVVSDVTMSGSVVGVGGGLSKAGLGALTLSGSNSYTGDTSISAGTLAINSSSSLGAAGNQITFTGNSTLRLDASFTDSRGYVINPGVTAGIDTNGNNFTKSGSISGGGALTKAGEGTLTLAGVNTYAGDTTVDAGTLQIGSATAIPFGAGKGDLVINGTLDLNRFDTTVNGLSGNGFVTNSGTASATLAEGANDANSAFSGVLQDGNSQLSVTKIGAGILTLAGTNTYTGDTTISAGTLRVGNSLAIPSGNGAGNVANNATLDLNGFDTAMGSISGNGLVTNSQAVPVILAVGANNRDGTFAGVIQDGSGPLSLTKEGSGTLFLTGVNTYSGDTTISAGVLQIGMDHALPSGSGKGNIVNNGTLDLNNYATTVNGLSGTGFVTNSGNSTAILTAGANDQTSTFAGVIQDGSGLLSLTKTGSGMLILTGVNTYSGNTTISAGILQVGIAMAIPSGNGKGNILDNGILDLNSFDLTVNGLSGTGIVTNSGMTGAILTTDANDQSSTFAGSILDGNGPISLAKVGGGTLFLTGSNTYSGDTTILAGVLLVGGPMAIPSGIGSGNVVDNATLDLNNTSMAIGGLSGNGVVTNSGTGRVTFEVGSNDQNTTFAGSIADGNGQLVPTKTGAGTLTLTGANTYSGDTTISGGVLQVGNAQAIPSGSGKGNIVNNGTLDLCSFDATVNGLLGTGIVTNSGISSSVLTVGANDQSSTFAGSIQDGNAQLSLTKTGAGTLLLTGVNTYSGDTTIFAGVLQVGNSLAIPSGAGAGDLVNWSTLDLNSFDTTIGGLSGNGVVTNSGTGRVVFTVGSNDQGGAFSGVIQDGGGKLSLTKTGEGTLTLTGSNTYSGVTAVDAGTLEVGSATAIPFGTGKGDVIVSGTLDLNNFDTTVNGLSGGGFVTNSGTEFAIFTAGGNNASGVFAGVIQDGNGQLAVTKVGTGTLTLAGGNAYSGDTTISAGVLQVGNSLAIPSGNGAGNVVNNATLDLNGFDAIVNGLSGSGRVTNSQVTPVTLTIGVNNSDGSFAGVIEDGSGQLSLTKAGTGTLLLTGVNTYSGDTTISDGVLQVGNAQAIPSGSGKGNVVNSGTLDLNNYNTTVNGLSGAGTVTNSGNTTAILTVGGNDQGSTFAGVIQDGSGLLALTKKGSGTLLLTGVNTYSGDTTICAGVLQIGNTQAIPSGNGKGNIANNGTLDLNSFDTAVNGLSGTGIVTNSGMTGATLTVGANDQSSMFAGTIQDDSGQISLTKTGLGTLLLTGSNTYTGDTTISAGVLQVGSATAMPSGVGSGNVVDNATLDVNNFSTTIGGLSGNGLVTNSGTGGVVFEAGGNGQNTTFSGSIVDGNGQLIPIKTGTGTLLLTGVNTYTGDTTISDGALQVGNAMAIPSGSGKGNIVNNGTLDLNSFDTTVNGLSGVGVVTNSGISSAALIVGANDQSSTFAGSIQDGNAQLSLTKMGAGMLTLTGVNTYSGDTTISAGVLQIGNSLAIPSGNGVGNVVNWATLDLNNFDTTIGGLTGNGVVTNSGTGSVVFTIGSNDQGGIFAGAIQDGFGQIFLTKTGAGTLTLTGVNIYSGDTTVDAGTLQIGNSAAIPFGAGNGDVVVNGTLDLNNFDTTVNGLSGSGFVTNSGTGLATFTVGGNGVSSTFAGALQDGSGQLAVTKIGAGILTLAGANTYSGDTTISAGVLQIGNSLAIPSGHGAGNVVNNATLDLNGFDSAMGGLSGSGRVTNSQAAPVMLTVGANDGDGVFTGVIEDGYGITFLTKAGAGVQTLAGFQPYSGDTAVNSGKLVISGTLANTASLSVPVGGTVLVNGLVNTAAPVTVEGTLMGNGTVGDVNVDGGWLAPGGESSPGRLTTGALTMSPYSNLAMRIGGTTAGVGYDQIVTNGPVTIDNVDFNPTLLNNYSPLLTDHFLMILNRDGTQRNIGNFASLPNSSIINLSNNLGTFPFTLHYGDYDHNGTTDVYLLSGVNPSQPVTWGGAGADSSVGVLDTSLIPTTSGTDGVRFYNVNGLGFDAVAVTKSLNQAGPGTLASGTATLWLEGGAASKSGNSIPYSTVTFRFYKTGTDIPFALTGIDFSFLDAEVGERFRSFAYWNSFGTKISDSLFDANVFSYSNGAIAHQTDSSVENGAPNEPYTQVNKAIGVDLSSMAISGFTIQLGRYNSSAGSVEMTALGDSLTPTGELLIQSSTDLNVSGNPNFITTSGTAILTMASITGALDSSNVSIATGTTQNIVINGNIVSGAGHSLSMTATQYITGTASLITSVTSGNAGAISLWADQSVRVGHLESYSSTGSGGAITVNAYNNITIHSDVDSSSDGGAGRGGAITLNAGNMVVADTLRSGGGGDVARAAAPGDIAVTANNSIAINYIYADSGSGGSPQITLTAPSITLGLSGTTAAEFEGTLRLQKPAGAESAAISISGTITGPGDLILDPGTGTASLDAGTTHSGQTHVLSGILAMNGNSLANSDLFLDNNSLLVPGVYRAGGYVEANSLTIGVNATFEASITSGTVYDQLRCSGVANLNGNFSLSTGLYIPSLGSSFQVMAFASSTGSFNAYTGLWLSDRVLQPVFTGTSMSLRTIASGASHPLQEVPPTGVTVSPGGYYDGLFVSASSSGLIMAATMIGGTASHLAAVTMGILASSNSGFVTSGSGGTNSLNLNGTGNDKFVLQLDYNETLVLASGQDENTLFLSWSDGADPSANAVLGNINLPGETSVPTRILGAYNPAADFHLGYYGLDTANHRVWAVVDHNSNYGLGVVPEPGTVALTCAGAVLLAAMARRRRR